MLLVIVFSVIGVGAALSIPFVFNESYSVASSYTTDQLESMVSSSYDLAGVPLVSAPSDNEMIDYSITGGGSAPGGTTETKVANLKRTLNCRVEPENPIVHKEALLLEAKHPGDYTIEQVSAIYSYLKENWRYVRDPRGLDYLNYANESLTVGKDAGCAGAGDCDDFAILMSALVESIGGTSRIILAQNNSTGGHAYTEVYLGQLNATNNRINDTINWLKQTFDTDKIYTHIDTDTKDIWLNLDWSADQPGGPFFKGSRHTLISVRDQYEKTSLRPPEGFETNKHAAETVKLSKPAETSTSSQDEVSYQNSTAPSRASYSTAGGADALIDQGIAQNNGGNYEVAAGLYDQALGLDPENYLAWDLKGLALRGLGKYDEALSCFDKAIAIESNRDNAWKDKGDTFYIMGQYQEAENCFDRAIQIKPCSDYWKQKGEALMGMGMDKEASDSFVMAQRGVSCTN